MERAPVKPIMEHLWSKKSLKEKMRDKRGMSIGDIYPVMLTIALVAILIAIVLYFLSQMQGNLATTTFSVANESDGWVNQTAYHLTTDNSTACNWNSPVIEEVWNWTGSIGTQILLPASNYTFDATTGTLTSPTILSSNYSSVNISYRFLDGEASCDAVGSIVGQISDFVPWIGIILLVVAAAIIIGILVRNLAGGQRV